MTDKRISDFPAATQWHPDAFIPQDNPAGLTEKVTPAQVETKLEADGFIKAASPSLGQVAAYTAGGWAPIKLADANIDAAAAIGWGKISKTGAVATDVGALPSLTLGGAVDANSINSGAPCVVKFQGVTSWANFPFADALLMSGKGGAFTQLVGKDSGVSQCWTDLTDGGTYRRNYVTAYGWSPWYTDWDSYNLPVGTTGKNVLAASSQSAARSAISALPIANPTATGALTAPDVVVSNLAGGGFRPVSISSTGELVAGSAFIDSAVLPLDVVAGGTPRNIVTTDIPANVFPLRIVRISFHYLIVATSGNSAYLSVSLGGQSRTDSTFGLGSDGSQYGKVVIDFMAASSNTLNQVATCTRRNGANLVSISEQNYKGSEFSALNFATDLALTVDLYESSSSATITVSQMVVEVR